MKRTQRIELWRTICKSPISFLSIVIVSALGVVAFCGISFSSIAVTNMGERYYQNANFYDLKVFSPTGFDDADIKELKAVKGVTDVYAGYSTHQLISISGENLVAEFFTQSETINRPSVKEGRLPQKKNECTIELPLAKRFNLKIGDTIKLLSDAEALEASSFVIVGIAELPLVLSKDDYYNRGVSALGDGQVGTLVILSENAFNPDAFLEKPVSFLTTSSADGIFTEDYITEQKTIQQSMEALGKQREKIKFEERRSEYNEKLSQAKTEYQTALKSYNDGLKAHNDSKVALGKKEIELNKLLASLNTTQAKSQLGQVNEKIASLDVHFTELAEKEKLLIGGRTQLDEAKTKLDELAKIEKMLEGVEGFYLGYSNEGDLSIWTPNLDAGFTVHLVGFGLDNGLIEGNFPTNENECAIEASYALEYGIKIGDKMQTSDNIEKTVSGIYEVPPESSGAADLASGVSGAKVDAFIVRSDNTFFKYTADFKFAYFVSEDNKYLNLVNENATEIKKALTDFIGDNENTKFVGVEEVKNELSNTNLTMRTEYEKKENEYSGAFNQYNAAKTELEDGKNKLLQARDALVSGISLAKDARTKAIAGLEQIKKGNITLKEKKAELDDAKKQLEEAENQIQDMETMISKLSSGAWTITGVKSNPSFHNFTTNLNGMESIVFTCCALLLLISTMVCYTTIGRMVSEQSRLIGTQKALGLKPREIYAKYITYAFVSTSLGVLLGVAGAYGFMENLIYNISYAESYQAVDFVPAFEIVPVLFIAAGSLFCSTLAAALSSRQLVRQNAVALLNGEITSMKRHTASAKSCFSINSRMAVRNILANKKILVTTLVGVAGCTILLIVAFTVRAGMAGVTSRQYDELQHYDGTIAINAQVDTAEQQKLRRYIESESGVKALSVCERYSSFLKDDEYHYTTLISSQSSELTEYISLIDAKTGENMTVPEKGVLISKKCAEAYQYSVGDEFVLTDSKGNSCITFVAGIFERSIGNALVVNDKYYREIAGEAISFNQYFVKLNDTDKDAFTTTLHSYSAFVSYTAADLYVDEFNYKLSCIDNAVSVILALTFMIAMFVLLNLAVMNIAQKETEITVMKALGFSKAHIQRYVLREGTLMSLIGLFLGVIMGGPIGAYITKAIELDGIQNIRGINLSACLIGAAICGAFFMAANILSLLKIRLIKMTGATRQA